MTIPISPYIAAHRLGEQQVQEFQAAAARRLAINQYGGKPPRRRRPNSRMVLDHWVAYLFVWTALLMLVAAVVIAGFGEVPSSLFS